jgi:hypothetical protein
MYVITIVGGIYIMKASQDGKTMKSVGGHTAIPNWSGFIYQGLCAAYEALRLCYKEPEKAQKYFLSLDAYEDFAILDENKKCLSLHQCKCYGPKSSSNFSMEFEKMRQRKKTYVDKGICETNTKLYFHCNQNVDVDKDIILYQYLDKTSNVNPNEIENKLGSLIDQINEGKDICINKGIFIRRLYFWIDNKVLAIHSKIMNNPGQTSFDIASGEILPINNLFQKLQTNGFSDLQNRDELASYCRAYYLKTIEKEMEESIKLHEDINMDSIDKFGDALIKYPVSDLWSLFVRLNPHKAVTDKLDILACGGDNTSQLYNVIKGVKKNVDDSIKWIKNGLFETPSTLPHGKSIKKLCYEIYNNRANLNVLFDYRWLVADTNQTVQSIGKEVPNILKNTEDRNDKTTRKESDKIFNPQDIGILTIDDKNNEKYN